MTSLIKETFHTLPILFSVKLPDKKYNHSILSQHKKTQITIVKVIGRILYGL